MATVLLLRWEGVTPAEYDAVCASARVNEDVADGGIFHICRFEDGIMHIVDVWESEADFQRFFAERLAPALAEVGVTTQPEVQVAPVHSYINGDALRAAAA